jgi:hypothetical protein
VLPDPALKTASSLIEFILAHRARQKTRPSLGVGSKPNAATKLKRGGFLEVQNRQTHCRVGFKAESAAVFRSPRLQENLPG